MSPHVHSRNADGCRCITLYLLHLFSKLIDFLPILRHMALHLKEVNYIPLIWHVSNRDKHTQAGCWQTHERYVIGTA